MVLVLSLLLRCHAVVAEGEYPILTSQLTIANQTKKDNDWQNVVVADAGDVIKLHLYYCNNILGTKVKNPQVRIDLESNQNSQLRFNAQIRADNADSVSNYIYVNLSTTELLNFFFDNNALWYSSQNIKGSNLNVSFPFTHSAFVDLKQASDEQCVSLVIKGTISQTNKASKKLSFVSKMQIADITANERVWKDRVDSVTGNTIKISVYYNNDSNIVAKNEKILLDYSNPLQFKSSVCADNIDCAFNTIDFDKPTKILLDGNAYWYSAKGGAGEQINGIFLSNKSVTVDMGSKVNEQAGFVVFVGVIEANSLFDAVLLYFKSIINWLIVNEGVWSFVGILLSIFSIAMFRNIIIATIKKLALIIKRFSANFIIFFHKK